ncbi:uncharacterized protein PAC_02003 [Phialocephala subalpina]|uniref:Uncharacterized protein n=1 Tax=Phialocephala subalpina TaxID=576137 RepID=A0A1L7WH68_9HELO|nr:uncharacterized protein PAC_02003 [Phialocephala subalpina]
MENRPFDRLNSDHSLNCGAAVIPTSGSLSARPASPAAERADQPSSGQHTLPLLRLSGWDSEKQYDKHNPIKARRVFADIDLDLVLAPSDFWKVKFYPRLDNYLEDEDKFPGGSYTCEETIIEISVERSRRRGLTKRCKKLEIDWQLVDEQLEGLSDLFSMGRKITLSMEFVYKEVTCDFITAKGKKKKKSAIKA